jgi:putative ABC transport system permease protein
MALVVRTLQPDQLAIANSIKKEVLSLDPDQPVSRIMTLEKACSSNMGAIQLGTSVLTLVATGALALAAVGIYGVLSFAVSQRTHEIGVRMALGARPRDVLRMVLAQGMRVTAWGVIPGLLASLALGRVLSNSMFGVAPVEVFVLAGISLLLTTISLMACYVPARRAAIVDPMQALKNSGQ